VKVTGRHLLLSATDLANHLACRYLTGLDLAAAEGRREPPIWKRPEVEILRERGDRHERAYLAYLEAQGLAVTRLDANTEFGAGMNATRKAMERGDQVIAQASLAIGRWHGRADVLRRIERPSDLGAWSYEVYDTKLARETRGGTILQLCLYSDLVMQLQGVEPERMYVVPPGCDFEPQAYRLRDYLAYYDLVRKRLEAAVETRDGDGGYPEPVAHCDLCRWWKDCDTKRRADDHLCLVAGITRLQQRELQSREIVTLESLASQPVPLSFKPTRGAREGYVRVREQARVQLEARRTGERVRELLPREEGRGLARLPAPSAGDVFLDLEGDPYVADGGLEYLFGHAFLAAGGAIAYTARWALDRNTERAGFESLVDELVARRETDPDLHVYHYSPYEPAALKRLMCRYSTREAEIDRMLRAGVFVDLYAIVKESLRASVEEYSIKALEPFYDFTREKPLAEARAALRTVEWSLEFGEHDGISDGLRADVAAYNRDDCVSALRLRDWLEGLREDLTRNGETIARPEPTSGEAGEKLTEKDLQTRALMQRLAGDVPIERAARNEEQQARWLLAQLLGWHRREEKAPWWEYYRLREMSDEDLMEEREAISGLEFVEMVQERVHRYRFPHQETSVRAGDEVRTRAEESGTIEACDLVTGVVDIKHAKDLRPSSVFRFKIVRPGELPVSLARLGEWVIANGVDSPGPHRAARDLLLVRPPRLDREQPLIADGETPVQAACRLALALDRGLLAIQGPPGAGKTYTAAEMIAALVNAGRKVGVSAGSHKVIHNLLEKLAERGIASIEKVHEHSADSDIRILETTDNKDVITALEKGSLMVGAGTQWMWARPEFLEAVDVLFVDEAGQMSLANALALAQGGKSLVLLGDPQQLEQPIQGTHPDGAGATALEHVLGDHQTMPADRGLFLPVTRRLHPRICSFTSEAFYENRLQPLPGLERQSIAGSGWITSAGPWFLPVEHDGNRNASAEEVAAVADLVRALTSDDVLWVDRHGEPRPIRLEDILIVAPFNAQVADLIAKLPGARIGTVDRFQGQEAPIAIFSLATSRPEDAPRGMEFLYNAHRFNVATSRAQVSCILVGSPRLFEPDCQSPRQMQLANAFCRYLVMAQEAAASAPGALGRAGA